MKKKENNLKKALSELLNVEGGSSGEASENQNEAETVSGQTEEDSAAAGLQGTGASEQPEPEEAVPASEHPAVYEKNSDISDSCSVIEKPVYETLITPDVIINGNIIAGSNLKILGQIYGNVECGGTIMLSGKIEGDVSANRLRFMAGSIQGNVEVREDIAAEKGTRVRGDVNAKSAVFSGNIQGEMVVNGNLELRETSSVLGNIKANGIAIFNGARIRGMLDIGGEIEEMSTENEE